jgi:eukaryotic-like serine/threonine-protein kinase
VVGTPGYMSAEQGLGEPEVDARADVWALGVMTYQMLSGVRPIPGHTIGRMLQSLFTHGIAPLRDRKPELPASLTCLVDRMLVREPEDRLSDLRAFYRELSLYARTTAPAFGPPAVGCVASRAGRISGIDGVGLWRRRIALEGPL